MTGDTVQPSPAEKDEWLDKFKTQVVESLEKMTDSALFVQLFSEKITDDPLAMAQLGLAIMLDKPVVVALPRGTPIPNNLRRLAAEIIWEDFRTQEGRERLAQRLQDGLEDQHND